VYVPALTVFAVTMLAWKMPVQVTEAAFRLTCEASISTMDACRTILPTAHLRAIEDHGVADAVFHYNRCSTAASGNALSGRIFEDELFLATDSLVFATNGLLLDRHSRHLSAKR